MPRIFVAAGTRRGLLGLAALAVLSGAAMLPAMRVMGDGGASLIAFEKAGSVARSEEILAGWGTSGESAMWWQLGLDVPFLVGYGLLLAGACAAVARRAAEARMPRLETAAALLAWFGPIAAAADMLQNVSLAIVLASGPAQPWPWLSAAAGALTTPLCAVAAVFALGGALATRRRTPLAPEPGG